MRGTITFLALCTALAALAQVPCKWTVDLARVTPADWDCLRGETVELMPSFVSGRDVRDLSGVESATLWWQTNGMGAAYWSAPASVDTSSRPHRLVARWTPDMDVGAASYRYFVGAAAPSGTQYRAHGTIRMRGAPGETPNALPLPIQVLDFAKIAWTNAPWGEGGGLTTNDVKAIAGGVIATNDVLAKFDEYGGLAVNGFLNVGDDIILSRGSPYAVIASDDTSGNAMLGSTTWLYSPNFDFDADREIAVKGDLAAVTNALAAVAHSGSYDDLSGTPSLGTAAYADAADFATAADEALVYQLLMGSNVVAEVTNYNSRVRAPQLRLLQLDPDTREYITVWTETNGLARTLAEAKTYADVVWQDLDDAKAPCAWSRTTSGLGADAPEGVTWISTPVTVIAGGYEYERHVTTHGEVWVLTSNGMGFGGDTNSYFRVSTPDGETLFSIEKTDEQVVGVLTDGINVSGGVVTLDVGVTTYNGQAPICMAAQSVSGPWSDLSEGRPAWISSVATNGVNGAWSFELESTSPAAFFYFLVRQPGATVIRNSAQTDFSGGILVEGTRFYPHKSGSTLTWTTTP